MPLKVLEKLSGASSEYCQYLWDDVRDPEPLRFGKIHHGIDEVHVLIVPDVFTSYGIFLYPSFVNQSLAAGAGKQWFRGSEQTALLVFKYKIAIAGIAHQSPADDDDVISLCVFHQLFQPSPVRAFVAIVNLVGVNDSHRLALLLVIRRECGFPDGFVIYDSAFHDSAEIPGRVKRKWG